jgi:phage tail protein X
MNEQDKTPIFDSKEYAKQVSELISKIESRKLSKEQLKDAQKSLADIQKLASEAIEKFKDILPDLTPQKKNCRCSKIWYF